MGVHPLCPAERRQFRRGILAALSEPRCGEFSGQPGEAAGGREARRAGAAGHAPLPTFLSCNRKVGRPPGRVPARVVMRGGWEGWWWMSFDRLVWLRLALLLRERKAKSRGGGTSTGIGSTPADRPTETFPTPLPGVDEESSAKFSADVCKLTPRRGLPRQSLL